MKGFLKRNEDDSIEFIPDEAGDVTELNLNEEAKKHREQVIVDTDYYGDKETIINEWREKGAEAVSVNIGKDSQSLINEMRICAESYNKSNMMTAYGIQNFINTLPDTEKAKLSDGYHSFEELYEFRKVYNAALFNEWGKTRLMLVDFTDDANTTQTCMYSTHKSWRHFDGELCFGGGWFIVSALLPMGQISNHYKAEDWDLFKVPEEPKALFEFDGHTAQNVLERLKAL